MAFGLLMIFKEKKEKTVPNQTNTQQTHQPKPQPLGSLSGPVNIYDNLFQKKSHLMKVNKESEKVGLKLNI